MSLSTSPFNNPSEDPLIRSIPRRVYHTWTFIASVSLLLVIPIHWNLSGKVQTIYQARSTILNQAPLVNLDVRLINIVTLGHRGLYDDFITIWTLQTLMDAKLGQYKPSEIYEVVMQTARLKPKIESFYLLSSFVIGIDLKRPDLIEEIIKHGLDAIPESWKIPLTFGFFAKFHLNRSDLAAQYYEIAGNKNSAPKYFLSYARKLKEGGELSNDAAQKTMDSILTPTEPQQRNSKMIDYLNKGP